MNWIKQNPFLSTLIGSTIALCAILMFIAMKGGSKYQDAKANFGNALMEVTKSEKLSLYPDDDNRQAKIKALGEHRESIIELSDFHTKYQIDPSVQLTTQQFTERVIAINEEVQKAFKETDLDKEAASKLPADFFMGFEAYRSQLAKSGSTALLDYQLQVVKRIMLGMAKARPSELVHIYRERIPEESDKAYEATENEVARKFSYELVFKGSEASVRDFITTLGDKESYYCVIRSIRINNQRDTPPRISDAKFERPAEAVAQPANPFGVFFNDFEPAEVQPPAVVPQPEGAPKVAVPEGPGAAFEEGAAPVFAEEGPEGPEGPEEGVGEEVEAPPAPAAPAVVPAAPAVVPAAPAVDSTRILSQVLGDEELHVFVRFDILLFSPTKELPKP